MSTDLSDINMEGVQPMGEIQELPVGQYLVRVEDSEKKETKDKYDENNQKLPGGHYLLLALKVYGGPNDGQVEFVRLNLWNPNSTAVNIAKSELKSIQDATNVHPVKGEDGITRFKSEWFHNKWMILEIKPGVRDPNKRFKNYHPAPEDIVSEYKHVPPVPDKNASTAAAAPVAAPPPAFVAKMPGAASVAATPSPAPAPGGLPSWAAKKVG